MHVYGERQHVGPDHGMPPHWAYCAAQPEEDALDELDALPELALLPLFDELVTTTDETMVIDDVVTTTLVCCVELCVLGAVSLP